MSGSLAKGFDQDEGGRVSLRELSQEVATKVFLSIKPQCSICASCFSFAGTEPVGYKKEENVLLFLITFILSTIKKNS